MKLYMKQKVFSWKDKFSVYDESGNEYFFVEGELFSWGKKLHVFDYSQKEVAFIRQELFNLLPKYVVEIDGLEVAAIVKEFSLFKPKYRIDGPGLEVNGDFWDHDYSVTRNGYTVVTLHKQWMSWGDCYEINVERPEDRVMAVAIVLAIDCVLDAKDD